MKNVRLAPLLTLVAVTTAVATDAPYFGKWKLNSSKSQLTGVVTIEKLPSGEYRFDEAGFVYSFRPDGKEYRCRMEERRRGRL